jgi:hypothetical protein
MRYSIGIAVMAVALIVGCGSDKSTGPELTLAEKLVGEWVGAQDEGLHTMNLISNGSYEATFVKDDESQAVFNEGIWELLPGDLLKITIFTSTDLKTSESFNATHWTFTQSVLLEGNTLTLKFLDAELSPTTYTRKN